MGPVPKDAGDEVLVDMIESASQTISCQNFSFESLWEGIRSEKKMQNAVDV